MTITSCGDPDIHGPTSNSREKPVISVTRFTTNLASTHWQICYLSRYVINLTNIELHDRTLNLNRELRT